MISTLPVDADELPFRLTNTFVGFSNYPNQVRKFESARGFSINIMLVGESGLGKRTFINSLFNCDLLESSGNDSQRPPKSANAAITIETTEAKIIEGDDTLEVSIVEARGFGDNLNNTDAWVDIVAEIDRRYDEYLQKEFAPSGTAGVVDPRIHACLYFVAPLAAGLRTLDVAFMKAIDGKVNLIPVIAKADAFTPTELAAFKAQVLREIDDHRIQIYRPTASSDALPDWAARQLRKIPYAVVGSNDIVDVDGYQYRGRKYPWGEVLVEEPDAFHDFLVLRSLLIEESLVTLKDETNRKHYEAYRKERLEKVGYDNYAKNIKLFCDKEMDISKLDAKREEAMAALKQKVASKEKKISEAEEEIMLKYRDIMQELSEKRKKYELKLKAYM